MTHSPIHGLRSRTAHSLGWGAALAVLAALDAPVSAGTFTQLNSGLNPANSGPYSTDGPRREVRGEVAHSDLTSTRVCFRYRSIIAVDVAALGNVESEGATSSYWIEFGVTEDPGAAWRVQLASHRRGDCNVIDDEGAYAVAEVVTQLSATYQIDSVPQGSLSALQFPTYSVSNEGISDLPQHLDIEDAATAFVSGVGTGFEQIVRVDFTWQTNVISHGGLTGGDEAAVRLGLSTTGLERIRAGDYPGIPSRDIDFDGHFVCATFCAQSSTSIEATATTSCAGSPVTLTAVGGGGATAQWFKDCCCGSPMVGSGRTLIVSPTTTSTYFMRWTSAPCGTSSCDPNPTIPGCGTTPCSPGITIHVVQPPTPPALIVPSSTEICVGSQVSLQSAGGGGGVQHWYSGSCGGTPIALTGSNILVSPTVTTTYYTRWENPPCAPSACASVTVLVSPMPVAPTSITPGDTTVCVGTSVTLTAVGGSGTSCRWSTLACGGPAVGGTAASIVVTPATTTTYFVRWEDAPCSASACASVTITVVPLPEAPTLVIAGVTDVCAGTPVQLDAFGGSGTTLRWFAGACGSQVQAGTGASISVTPLVTTTYHARWDSPPCALSACSATVVVNVTTGNVAPSGASASDADICAGTTTLLSAFGGSGTTLRWYSDSCGGALVGVGNGLPVTPAATTRYYARWESPACLASTCASVEVVVEPIPTAPASISADVNPVCAGSPVVLAANGGSGATLRWYRDGCAGAVVGTGTPITVTPSQSATYFARWESASCGNSACASVAVSVSPLPAAPTSATASSVDICVGETTVLSAVGGSGQFLHWRAGSCSAGVVYSGPAVGFAVSPASTTTYFASFGADACADSSCASVTVTVHDLPQNDDCAQAIDLFAATTPASLITNFSTRCATTDGPAHAACAAGGDPQVGHDVWFRYHATIDGSLRISTCNPAVTDFDTRIAVYSGIACPVDGARLLTCVDDSGAGCAPGTTVNVRVVAGTDCLIRVGGRNAAEGTGQILTQLTVATPCPPPGPLLPHTYSLCGSSTNVTWLWRIRAAAGGFTNVQGTAGPVPFGGSAYQLAVAFRDSIQARVATLPGGCAGNLTSTAMQLGLTDCGGIPSDLASLSIACTVPIQVDVWDGGLGGWCTLDSDSTTQICQFNPYAEQVPLPGLDCNHTGVEDVVDIFLGTSSDVDGNQIPDECPIPAGTGYCFGDGSGAGCPCGNNAPIGVAGGCLNSLGQSARLVATGIPSILSDSLRLSAEGMPNSSALYFQGTTQIGSAFGDGLRCVGGTVLRLGTVLNSGNASIYPRSGDPSISLRGQVTAPGSVRRYQVWYRNAAAFCTVSTFNLSNGVSVTWAQ